MDNFVAHILVVDDDEGIRTLVKKYLNENNYLVTTANSAEDAFEKIQIIKFDLIILDIMMPGKSGLEFIKENQKKLDTPVILLTAKGEADERVEGLEIGASIKISFIKLPENVTPTIQGRDFVIATVAAPTVVKEPEKPAEATEEAAAGEGGEAATEGEKPAEGDEKAKEEVKPAEKK